MAGKPQPASRRAPPAATQADGLTTASREAAAADWGVAPKKSGVRGEVKLALMLILTLAGAFGYIVHRKFQVLRNEVVAAEGEQFHPLVAADPRNEINLPPVDQPDPESPGADPHWAAHDLSQQASNNVPPVLAVTASATSGATTPSDPFPTTAVTTTATPAPAPPRSGSLTSDAQLPFPEMAAQSEPDSATTSDLPWSPNEVEPAATDGPFRPAPPTTVAAGQLDEIPFLQAADTPTEAASSAPRVAVADALPFAADSVPAPNTTPQANGIPLDLFGEPPVGSAAMPETEPTFSPAAPSVARTPEPAFAEPSFAQTVDTTPAAAEPPSFTPLAGDDPFGSPATLQPPQTVADSPVTIQPTLEPAPLTVDAPAPLLAQPTTPTPAEFPALSAPQNEPAFPVAEPRVADSPPPAMEPQSGDAVPWSGPRMTPEPQLARDPFPSPVAPSTTLDQSNPTTPDPNWSPTPSLTRIPEPVTPTFPESQPTPTRERSLFDDPPSTALSEPTPTPPPAPTGSGETLYTVRPGDNYWTIAKSQYGSVRYFAALTEYNRGRVPDPQKMRPGLQVAIPDATVLESQYPQLFAGPAPSVEATRPNVRTDGPGDFFVSAGEPHYRVGEGDTLSSIAQKHLGRASRWEQVYTMNRDVLPSPDRLKPGTVIRLPRDASQIAVTPGSR